MTVYLKVVGVALCLLAWLALPVQAGPLSAEERVQVDRVVSYLNDIRSMSAEFVQIGPNGEIAKGQMYLNRPGKLRFEYAPPTPLLLVADGFWLTLVDTELEQAHRWPVSDTPLGLLVADRISLDGEADVIRVERRGGVLRVTFVDAERPEEGALTLMFTEPRLALQNWEVLDAQGGTTTVSLQNVRTNLPLEPDLFTVEEPKPFSGTSR